MSYKWAIAAVVATAGAAIYLIDRTSQKTLETRMTYLHDVCAHVNQMYIDMMTIKVYAERFTPDLRKAYKQQADAFNAHMDAARAEHLKTNRYSATHINKARECYDNVTKIMSQVIGVNAAP